MLGLLRYVDGDLDDPATYSAMSAEMGEATTTALFYLEVPPSLFGRIAEGISGAGRADGARVMVEKPFGKDLDGAQALNATMRDFDEDAIYRVDHWLGLDPLNDVVVARFANSMIEPLLDREHVESIQITMAEAFDVADRGRFYDAPARSATSCRTTCCRCSRASSPTRRTVRASTRGWTPRPG